MKQYNSLYNVIIDAVIAITFVTTMIINAYTVNKVTTTFNKIEQCNQNAKDYPTLKNQEVMTLKKDSLLSTIDYIYN